MLISSQMMRSASFNRIASFSWRFIEEELKAGMLWNRDAKPVVVVHVQFEH